MIKRILKIQSFQVFHPVISTQTVGKEALQIYQISLQSEFVCFQQIKDTDVDKGRRIPIASLSHLAYILIAETSAGLIVSEASATTSGKAEEFQACTKRHFTLCNCLLG